MTPRVLCVRACVCVRMRSQKNMSVVVDGLEVRLQVVGGSSLGVV
jgi:hypothetical protein